MDQEFHGLMKGQKFGQKYQLEKFLRRGGEAEIWQAIDTETQEIVAIRMLMLKDENDIRDAQRHFAAEVQILQQLARHPHIISLLDSGWDHGLPYLVMPYIPDGSLATLLADLKRRGQQLPFEDAVLYIQQTLDALIYVHRYGIIHRDVKPANLLRGEHGILLNDWGIAFQADVTFPLTRANIGTLPYLAPEQERGTPVFESDQYAMAVTGCEIITGHVLSNGGDEDLQRSYPHIAKVFKQAWDLDATRRFASMQAFAKAFQNAVRAERLSGSTHSMSDPLSSPSRIRGSARPKQLHARWLIGAAIVLLLGASVLGAYAWLRPMPTTILCLETDLPETGPGSPTAQGISRGVQVALAQQTNPFINGYKGYRIIQNDMDDSSGQQGEGPDPIAGVRNIQTLFQQPQTNCPNPIAIIGPADSTVAAAEIPVAAMHHILLLSPSATAPCLTQVNYSGPNCSYLDMHPPTYPNTFGRLPITDNNQGSIIANFLLDHFNVHNLVIVEDEEIYGIQITQAVMRQLQEGGGSPIREIDCVKSPHDFSINPSCSLNKAFSTDDVTVLATHIAHLQPQPDAIFFAGLPANGAVQLRLQLGVMGLNRVPFVGGDAFVNQAGTFFTRPNFDATNMYATFPAPDPSTFLSGTPAEMRFYSQYQKMFGFSPVPYSAYGYDAANIILQAIKNMLDAGQSITPANVAQAVLDNDSEENDFISLTGNSIHFNQDGDNIGPQSYTIYQAEQKKPLDTWDWHPYSTQSIEST